MADIEGIVTEPVTVNKIRFPHFRFDELTTDILDRLPKHSIFATGVKIDNEHGINFCNTGKWLRWVAVTGEIGDWAIYVHHADYDQYYIKLHGDKVISTSNIRRTIKCDDAAFARYRY